MAKLSLNTVTLCAASSVNVMPTMTALEACLRQIDFAECLFFTDADIVHSNPNIRIVPISRLGSGSAYSNFILEGLVDYVRTSHCLIVQWDGFVLDAAQWDSKFLSVDYVGARWPQFEDGHDVGNGGFSLRSRRLLEACRDPGFRRSHPEDVAICRVNRAFLERTYGIRFANGAMADQFAFERKLPTRPAFGFHGVFNMIAALGPDRFWEIYLAADDRSAVFLDYALIMRQLGSGSHPLARRLRLTADLLGNWIQRKVDRFPGRAA